MMIDKQSPLPIYYQLEQEIRKQIESGALKAGELLPSERVYTERYNISRMTVRQAINQLANEGLLVRLKGKGTYIAEQKLQHSLTGITSFSEEMKQRGLTPSSNMISFEVMSADDYVAGALQLETGETVMKVERVRLADKEPIAFETSFIPKKLVGDIQKDVFASSFYQYVENVLHFPIKHGEQDIESALANEKERRYLKLESGSPVLLITRRTYVKNEQPIEFVKTTYRADKYKYKLQLPR